MNCRDCGGDSRPFGYVGMRADICESCMKTRGNVIKAMSEKTIPIEDFQKYQRNGLRTKRLVKMGYGHLIAVHTPKP